MQYVYKKEIFSYTVLILRLFILLFFKYIVYTIVSLANKNIKGM